MDDNDNNVITLFVERECGNVAVRVLAEVDRFAGVGRRGCPERAIDRVFHRVQLEAQTLERGKRQDVFAGIRAARYRRTRRLPPGAAPPLLLVRLQSFLLSLLVLLHVRNVRFRYELVSALALARWSRS